MNKIITLYELFVLVILLLAGFGFLGSRSKKNGVIQPVTPMNSHQYHEYTISTPAGTKRGLANGVGHSAFFNTPSGMTIDTIENIIRLTSNNNGNP